ncbi:hypothetical protein V8D89_004686 [Ganoderma adspersum]
MGYIRKSLRKASQKAVNGDTRSRTAAQVGFLPMEAYTVLRTYCTQVTRHPSKAQFQELVAKIQHIPGCEDCQIRKLRAYFKERRKTEARAQLAAEHKARNHPKPADTIEVAPNPSPSSRQSTTPSEPDAPSTPSLSSPHLQDPSPSRNNGVLTTFIDLIRWLQEQNTRFTDFTPQCTGLGFCHVLVFIVSSVRNLLYCKCSESLTVFIISSAASIVFFCRIKYYGPRAPRAAHPTLMILGRGEHASGRIIDCDFGYVQSESGLAGGGGQTLPHG